MHPQAIDSAPKTSPSGSHRTLTLVIAALAAALVAGLLGLVVGGLGGFLISAGTGDSGSRVDQNVAEGCAIMERLDDELPVDTESLDIEDPLLFELMGAGNLFMAAGVGPGGVEAYWEAGNKLISGASRLQPELLNEGIDDMRGICAGN